MFGVKRLLTKSIEKLIYLCRISFTGTAHWRETSWSCDFLQFDNDTSLSYYICVRKCFPQFDSVNSVSCPCTVPFAGEML